MHHTKQLGFSLLESLMALALASALCVSLMRSQIRLLQHTRQLRYQQLAARAHLSLAERLRSCGGNPTCQRTEMESFQTTIRSFPFSATCNLTQTATTITSTLYWGAHKESTTLIFDYA